MRCNEFDTHIDEMLSGVLHPDATQHAQQCERCNSHLRARTNVHSTLRKLASAPVGPSRATDRAVMESYRRLQQRKAAWNSAAISDAAPSTRLRAVPSREPIAPRSWFPQSFISRTWLSGAAAAALVLGVFGSAVHLWTGTPTVSAPTIATAPASPAANVSEPHHSAAVASLASRPVSNAAALKALQARARRALNSQAARAEIATANVFRPAPSEAPVLASRTIPTRAAVAFAGGPSYESGPVTQMSASAAPVMRLASSGNSGNVAESASSTWPGYSNLMYCDPVICSGPMQVVRIKVPVREVKPNLGQTVGNAFVDAEVVVGPDGVARAIRVAR